MKLKNKFKKIFGIFLGNMLLLKQFCFADVIEPSPIQRTIDDADPIKLICIVLAVIFVFGLVSLYYSNKRENSDINKLTKDAENGENKNVNE